MEKWKKEDIHVTFNVANDGIHMSLWITKPYKFSMSICLDNEYWGGHRAFSALDVLDKEVRDIVIASIKEQLHLELSEAFGSVDMKDFLSL